MSRQCKAEECVPCLLKIRRLMGRRLKTPLVATVESASIGFVAHAAGIPVFGYGDDEAEAFKTLREGLEKMCRQEEEFLDLRTNIQRMLLLENLSSDVKRGTLGN